MMWENMLYSGKENRARNICGYYSRYGM